MQRNLNVHTNTNTQRAKSLNPLIYPDWWGDGGAEEQAQTEQPQIRNQAHRGHKAHQESLTEEKLIEHNNQQRRSGDHRQSRGTFQIASQRIQNQDIDISSSNMSLADALAQAKETAQRLERGIDQSKRQRDAMMAPDAFYR